VEAGWDEVRARRLLRSSLNERATGDRLVEVVRAVCDMHAQVQASAELQLAARVDVVQADVRGVVGATTAGQGVDGARNPPSLSSGRAVAVVRAAVRSVDRPLPAMARSCGVLHAAVDAEEIEAVRAPVSPSS
jgi:hypothetical protein